MMTDVFSLYDFYWDLWRDSKLFKGIACLKEKETTYTYEWFTDPVAAISRILFLAETQQYIIHHTCGLYETPVRNPTTNIFANTVWAHYKTDALTIDINKIKNEIGASFLEYVMPNFRVIFCNGEIDLYCFLKNDISFSRWRLCAQHLYNVGAKLGFSASHYKTVNQSTLLKVPISTLPTQDNLIATEFSCS